MHKTSIEKMLDLYIEICEEAGLEWTLEGWDYFDKVICVEYLKHCKIHNLTPNKHTFRKDCIAIALDMKKQAL